MNIVIDIRPLTSPERTGVGEYTYELLSALFSFERTHTYFLFYNSYKDVLAYLPQWQYPNVHFVGTRWPNKLLSLSLFLFRRPLLDQWVRKIIVERGLMARSDSIDYFFSPNINFTAVSREVRHLLTIHDLSFFHFPWCFSLKRRWWHRLIRPREQATKAFRVLTPSQSTKQDVLATYGVPEQSVSVLAPGLSSLFVPADEAVLRRVREKYQLPEKYLLFLGTIEPRKNIESCLDAFQLMPELRLAGYELIIAGAHGWKYDAIVRKIRATPGARSIGYVDPMDKVALYQGASVFLYPSFYEGFGFPVLEAMAAGVPVITSHRSSLPEVGGDAVYYVNPLNIYELSTAIKRIVTDEGLCELLIQKGEERSLQFRWHDTAKEFFALL